MSPHNPLLPDATGRFRAMNFGDFPKNEHWRWRATEDSIAWEIYVTAQ